MAAGKINLQKASGGITAITGVDGTGNTEVVLPESGELVTKDYADLKVALTEFTGDNQSLATNGYQKLPGGLILQWGVTQNITAGVQLTVTFPIAFPNSSLQIVGTIGSNFATATTFTSIYKTSSSQFKASINSGSGAVYWIAIGY